VGGKRTDANVIARTMADTVAMTFRCGTDQPRIGTAAVSR